MRKTSWYEQRIDRKNGDIAYELHSVTKGFEPEQESFIRFEGPNAKRDVAIFMRGLDTPPTDTHGAGDE